MTEFINNNKVFVSFTGQLFFLEGYDTQVIIENFTKLRTCWATIFELDALRLNLNSLVFCLGSSTNCDSTNYLNLVTSRSCSMISRIAIICFCSSKRTVPVLGFSCAN